MPDVFDAFEEGQRAFDLGKTIEDCPAKFSANLKQAFTQGYVFQKKKDRKVVPLIEPKFPEIFDSIRDR